MKFCLVCRVYLNHQSKVLSEKVSVALSVLSGRSQGWSGQRAVRTHVCGKIGAVRVLRDAVSSSHCVSHDDVSPPASTRVSILVM